MSRYAKHQTITRSCSHPTPLPPLLSSLIFLCKTPPAFLYFPLYFLSSMSLLLHASPPFFLQLREGSSSLEYRGKQKDARRLQARRRRRRVVIKRGESVRARNWGTRGNVGKWRFNEACEVFKLCRRLGLLGT